ncbi:hypothetical protein [Serratia proteamaculans]
MAQTINGMHSTCDAGKCTVKLLGIIVIGRGSVPQDGGWVTPEERYINRDKKQHRQFQLGKP